MPRSFLRFALTALGIGGALSLTMCGGGGGNATTTTTGCPEGICGPGSTGSGGKSSSSTGTSTSTMSGMGGMSSSSVATTGPGGSMSTTTGSMASSTGSMATVSSSGSMASSSATSSGGCVPAWVCTPWDTGTGMPASSNAGHRMCTDTNNCPGSPGEPATSANLPALDFDYFECNVEPILDKKCAQLGCHGTETGRALRLYARARLREATGTFSSASCSGTQTGTECTGSNSCPCTNGHTQKEWQRNFDSARGFALDANGNPIPMASLATESDMIHQPVFGGASHSGIHLFHMGDADYTTILNWLSGSTLASCNVGNN